MSIVGDRFVSNNDEGWAQSCDTYIMAVPAERRMPTKPTALDLVGDKGMVGSTIVPLLSEEALNKKTEKAQN
jgi:hypothetical protein